MFGGIPFGFGGMPGGMPGGMGGRRGPSEPVDNNKFYAELGIEKNATPEEINRAHKKAAVKHHPDRGGDPEKVRGPSASVCIPLISPWPVYLPCLRHFTRSHRIHLSTSLMNE